MRLSRPAPTDDPGSAAGSRRRVLLALALALVLAAAVSTYVVWGPEEPQAAAPIHVTGSTPITLPGEQDRERAQGRQHRRPHQRSQQRSSSRSDAADPGSPRRLVIPALDVDSTIVPISAPGGTLTPPSDAQQVGWWSAGAEPGAEVGSALMTGHTLSRGGAALQDLETLAPGDRMSVRTADGAIAYRVSDVEVFSKGTVAAHAEELFSQSAPGRLVVITCEDYNGSTYLSNVVVTAVPAGRAAVDS